MGTVVPLIFERTRPMAAAGTATSAIKQVEKESFCIRTDQWSMVVNLCSDASADSARAGV